MAWCIALLVLLAAVAALLSIAGTGIAGAPWLPTPGRSLPLILREVELRTDETILDIGCGDGRVLITAAQGFGARAIGVDIDPVKTFIARWRVRRAGLEGRIRIMTGSALATDLREADVVFLYLSHQLIDKLKPKFEAELKPSARIVSYRFMVRGWPLWRVDARKEWFIYRMDRGRSMDTRI